LQIVHGYAQIPLHTFHRNFAVAREFVMEFGKRHDTTGTRANLLRTCCGLATGKLPTYYGLSRENWFNGLWPIKVFHW